MVEMSAGAGGGQETFDKVMAQIKARLGADVFNSWFGRMKLDENSPNLVRFSVPTAFLRSWINGHYLELLTELWRKEEPRLLRLEVLVRSATRLARAPEAEAVSVPKKPLKPAHSNFGAGQSLMQKVEKAVPPRPNLETDARQQVLGSPLDPRYTFESFVEGPSNRVALCRGARRGRAACQRDRASIRSSFMPRWGSARRICCRRSPPKALEAEPARPASSI